MVRYEVIRDCYGFRNSFWEKGQIVEVDPKEKPPKHFKLLDSKSASTVAAPNEEAKTYSGMAREEMLNEAKSRGIKDAEILNDTELLEVLTPDITQDKIKTIVQKARKRPQSK